MPLAFERYFVAALSRVATGGLDYALRIWDASDLSSPLIAALAMSASSITVSLNALRLR